MQNILDECRWLYNNFLEQRKTAWQERQENISLYAQHAQLKQLKASRQSLKNVHSQVLQNVAVRLDLAFQAFFRRIKLRSHAVETATKSVKKEVGYPRFKSYDRYDSFCYPQSGYALQGGVLSLSKIGQVRVKLHRPTIGEIKTVCVQKKAGFWYVCFTVECDGETLPASNDVVGIDVGLNDFAFLSTEEAIANPRFYRRDEKDMRRVQRRVSRAGKGSPSRRKARKALAKVHGRIANRRRDFAHQESRKIVDRFGIICVEDIHVNRMVHNHCLAKSIMDVAWSMFFEYLAYKVEETGRRLVKVNPAYTTQDCNQCGHRQKMPLSERMYSCPCCGLSMSRDLNASLNILRLGTQSFASA